MSTIHRTKCQRKALPRRFLRRYYRKIILLLLCCLTSTPQEALMKRAIIAVVLASSLVFTGCIGSFSLTNKLYSWNEKASNKFVNTGILWVLAGCQVYSATIFIDGFILNVIEFWTGTNPMGFTGPETLEKDVMSNGKTYHVTMGNSKITIDQVSGADAGKGITLRYDSAKQSYFLDDWQGNSRKVGTLSDGTLKLIAPDGSVTSRHLNVPAEPFAAAF